jgi:hypothetical protein
MSCAHVFLHIIPTEVGGTEIKVSEAGSYLEGKPEGDNSMAFKSLVRLKHLSREFQAATLYMVKAELLESQSARLTV